MEEFKRTRQWTIILFIMNIIFWMGIWMYFTFVKYVDEEAYLMVKILLFGEPVLFTIGLAGYLRRSKLFYLLTLLFLFGNSVLSITDEVGIFDLISLVLSLLMLVVLVIQWRTIILPDANKSYTEVSK